MIPDNFEALLRSDDVKVVQQAHTRMKNAIKVAEGTKHPSYITEAKRKKLELKKHLHEIGGETKDEQRRRKEKERAKQAQKAAMVA